MWTSGKISWITLRGQGAWCPFDPLLLIRLSSFLPLFQLRPCSSGNPRGRKQWIPFLSSLPPPHKDASVSGAKNSPLVPLHGAITFAGRVDFCGLFPRRSVLSPEQKNSCFCGDFASGSSRQGPHLLWEDSQCPWPARPGLNYILLSPLSSSLTAAAVVGVLPEVCCGSGDMFCPCGWLPISSTCYTIGLKGFLGPRRVLRVAVLSLDRQGFNELRRNLQPIKDRSW